MRKILTILLLLISSLLYAKVGVLYQSSQLSNSLISSVCQDKTGFIWVGTDYGLNRFDGYNFVKYFHENNDSTSLIHNTVVCVYSDRDGRLWVGSSRGLQQYDYTTDSFINYYFPHGNRPRVNDIKQLHDGRVVIGTAGYGLFEVDIKTRGLKEITEAYLEDANKYFSHIFEGSNHSLWKAGANDITCREANGKTKKFPVNFGVPSDFFSYKGMTVVLCSENLLVFDKGRMITDFFDLSAAGVGARGLRTAYVDGGGNIYIGTRGKGLFWIPAGSRTMQRYPCSVNGLDLTSTKIWAITGDRNGNIWVGCQQRGLLMIPNRQFLFNSWSFSNQKIDIGTYVSSISDSNNGIIWCTVQDKGVYGFDYKGKVVAHPSAPDGAGYIYRDSKNDYWLGTQHGMYSFNPYTGATKLVADYPCYSYNTMTDDHQGTLFFSMFSKGMMSYNRETKQVRCYSMNDKNRKGGRLCNDWIMDLSSDYDHKVWAATSSGVSCYDPKKDTFRPHGWDVLLQDTMCYAVCKTSRGDMLIGTECGIFIWYRKTNKVERFKNSQAMSNLAVGYMVEDTKGNIWCSTSNGIWRFDVKTSQWSSFVNGSGLTSHEYVNSVGLHDDYENIFFATGDGITMFHVPDMAKMNKKPGKILLTGFYVDGKAVSITTESGGRKITDLPVIESHDFTLSYTDNSYTLAFSLMDYADADNVIFEYRIDDSKEWTRTPGGKNTITFTQVAPAKHVLHVRAIANGVTTEEVDYTIEVRAPWYASTLAYIIYILLLVCVIYIGVYMYRRHLNMQMDEDKMKFLINATHDIRSPLTLIMSPLAKLKEQTSTLIEGANENEDEARILENMTEELSVIDRNSQRILNLVNQILDIRKIDKQQMSLHCHETDMKDFIDVIFKVFEYNAKERNINYRLVADKPIMAWFDNVQFDKVVSNLISNAFKYTHNDGEVIVSLSEGHDDSCNGPLKDYVEIKVMDSGIGMREDVLQHIFDRFYQAKNHSNDTVVGTGIGLNLCKMIVDMHHGSLKGENRSDGITGSVFTVRIPKGKDHLDGSEIDTQVDKPVSVKIRTKQTPRYNYHVLIVDDDAEIGTYISKELSPFYHFTVCYNGKEGLKELLTNEYDAVVSDVMMPEMDGFTMLRMIKSNVQTNHIPVIMLTTKSDIGNRLEGLEKGADAYMTKPFTMEELHLTIDNLIENHLRLRGKFSGAQQPTEQVEMPEVKGNDEQLMERIIKSVNAHLSDSDYGVETMCDEVGISRAHLYRKMKDLTGISVSEFVRNIRLEQAARLLKEQKVNVTQVAYTVGFSSLGYFSTVFRKHFGMSPREYIEQNEK